jgi:glutathione S-transferase
VAITLYRAPFSTNVERVSLALAYKGLDAESVEIDYADRSAVVAVSGQGLVPIIVDGGHVVNDSLAILRHLERRNPDPPLFAPGAILDVFMEWFDAVWKVPPNAIANDPDGPEVEAHATRMDGWLDMFERLLEGRDHLLGDFSAADCVAFPFLKYARPEPPPDDDPFHLVLAERQSLENRPNLAAWIERVDARPRV